MANWEKIKIKKEQILKDFPFLTQYNEKAILTKEQIEQSYYLAYKIGLEEHKFYDQAYKLNQAANPQKSNPCKDFTF